MPRKLKVFKTSAGFDDAYVAAPSRKAALAAWGAGVDLFARGIAEETEDPDLMARPLKNPGQVFTVSRGDLAAHLKALGTTRPKQAKNPAKTEMRPVRKKLERQRPPPRRDKLEAAERDLEQAEARYRRDMAHLEKERAAAEEAIARLKAKRDKGLAALSRKREAARRAYQDAVDRWSD